MPPVVFPPIATPYIPTYPVSLPPSDSGGTGIASTGGGQGTSSGTVNVYNPPIALPIASFTYRVYAGGLVAFTNTSLNNPTIFLWNFGDGSTSTAKNPFHLYTSAGTKTITLTVQNSGGTNSSSQSINITILAEAANYTYVASGLKVFFTDTSTVLGGTFLWDFGDGSTSTEQNPTHTFSIAGDYIVTLTVNGTYVKEQTVSVVAGIDVLLQWDDNSDNETGFKIEHSLNGDSWTQIKTVGAGVTSYLVTIADGVDGSVLNYFRVRAYNADGDSAYTNTISKQCSG